MPLSPPATGKTCRCGITNTNYERSSTCPLIGGMDRDPLRIGRCLSISNESRLMLPALLKSSSLSPKGLSHWFHIDLRTSRISSNQAKILEPQDDTYYKDQFQMPRLNSSCSSFHKPSLRDEVVLFILSFICFIFALTSPS